MDVNINITFNSGIGNLTITLERSSDGSTESQTVEHTTADPITFTNVESNDSFSMIGACAGTTIINIDVPTIEATPYNYPSGKIDVIFIVS